MKNAETRRSAAWTKGLINLGLVLISLALGYVVLGAVLLAYGPAIAWKPFNQFPTAAAIPWQPSGPSDDKQPYIAILGDSYAQGLGDWNYNRKSRTEPYYSGDVISRELGVPVISFGRNNAGSIDALVTSPSAIMNADSCILLRSPAQPGSLVVYVYEGNDFDNNIRDLRKASVRKQETVSVADYIRNRSRSVENVSCYRYMKNILSNLFLAYTHILFPDEVSLDHSTGQAVRFEGRTGYIPNGVQGPAMELDNSDLNKTFDVLSQSLDHLITRFRNAPVLVVYAPSILTVYDHLGDTVTVQTYHNGESRQPTERVYRASDALCIRTQQLALSKGLSFVDARPDLRAAAAKREVHGPLDWRHLNRAGQTSLGLTVARAIEQDIKDSGCVRLAAEH